MSAAESMEHAEHVSHAGHGHESHDHKLGPLVGVTLAMLGVLLAFSTALVGSERTLLTQSLIEQEHAHAKYQAQDIKHRTAILSLTQTHAELFGAAPPPYNKDDIQSLARTAERYLEESRLARDWTYSFDGLIEAHVKAQEEYEHGQLCAEIGIVLASIALMLRRRVAWIAAVILGVASIFFTANTKLQTSHEIHTAQHLVDDTEAKYEEARKSDKTTDAETKLIEDMINWAPDQKRSGH